MEEKEAIVISRYWNHPEIMVGVGGEGIRLGMEMKFFLHALSKEIKHPAAIMTRSQLLDALSSATDKVLEHVKESSTPVVSTIKKV
jgi:hypothetical protein